MIADNFNKKEEACSITFTGVFNTGCLMGPSQWILSPTPPSVIITFDEIQQLIKAKKDLKEMIDVQGQVGNWTCNEYMRGLLNGLVLAGVSFGLTTMDDMKDCDISWT